MILNYISLPIFMISLAIGLFFVYVLGPEMKVVYVYPTPDNVDKILFQDDADNCFSYQPVETQCPADLSKIASVPVQSFSKET